MALGVPPITPEYERSKLRLVLLSCFDFDWLLVGVKSVNDERLGRFYVDSFCSEKGMRLSLRTKNQCWILRAALCKSKMLM